MLPYLGPAELGWSGSGQHQLLGRRFRLFSGPGQHQIAAASDTLKVPPIDRIQVPKGYAQLVGTRPRPFLLYALLADWFRVLESKSLVQWRSR